MFENLKKKANKEYQLKKEVTNYFFYSHSIFFFLNQIFAQIIFPYIEKAYEHKKFQNFSIKTLTAIACPNFKS